MQTLHERYRMLWLQLLGLFVTICTVLVAVVCFKMWATLRPEYKVWTLVLWIGWCSLISSYPVALAIIWPH